MDKFNISNIPRAPITKLFIKQFLPDSPVIVEAGAHIGRDTIKMANTWPNSTIHAFEPVPELFATLKLKTSDHANIFCYPFALSDTIGTETLYVSSGASTAASSLLKPKDYVISRPEVIFNPIEVKTITLDYWAEQNNINHIDFMWLDMQGAELKALQAGLSILKTVKAIFIEASLTERFENNPLYDQVKNWIESQGFIAIQEDIPKHNKINIFFVKK